MPPFHVFRLLQPIRLLLLGALSGAVACGGEESRARDSLPAASGAAGALAVPLTGGAPAAAGFSGFGGSAAAGVGCVQLDPEPNDDRIASIFHQTWTDCDSGAVLGTLAGDDVDWWHFTVEDSLGCSIAPAISSENVLRLCAYAICSGGTETAFTCEPGTEHETDGCCELTPATLEPEVDCEGIDDRFNVWVRVSQDWTIPLSDRDCLHYAVDVRF